jgi:hypothetical protein
MKSARILGLGLTLLVLMTLSCQTVTGLAKGKATSTPFRLTLPQGTALPQAPSPAVPKSRRTVTAPAAGGAEAPMLGTTAETKAALAAQPDNVLEALASERYTPEEMAQMNQAFPYTIDLAGDEPVLWTYGWGATTAATLKDNLKHIQPQFLMNGAPVDIGQFYAFDSQSTDSQTNTPLTCHSYAALVTHWPPGETQLETIVTFDAKINDGIGDYAPGAQTFDYTVTRP